MPDLRDEIKTALQDFNSKPLRKAALNLLDILGYRSDRTLVLEGSKPQAFLDLVQSQPAATKFDPTKALFSDWKSADILFQLTDEGFAKNRASYNEETKTTARKQTGSFYTPRPIVDYMVDESLKAHLERKLTTESTENTENGKSRKPTPSDPSSSVLSVSSVVKNSSGT